MATLLTPEQRGRFIAEFPEWTLDGEEIARTFDFDDFSEAMGFVTRVAIAAEKADHHPDIDIRWNKVALTLTTHSAKGLTEKDTDLAATIDGLTG
jgi:4a-hydroxytetrahydrobiopterin dehydratase